MHRHNRNHKVWRDELDSAAIEQFAEEFKSQWQASSAVVGIVFVAENAKIYKNNIPDKVALKIWDRPMYGDDVHAYLEFERDGAPGRLTFLVYHPEGYLYLREVGGVVRGRVQDMARSQYELCFSVAFPGQPIPKFPPPSPENAKKSAKETLQILGVTGNTFDFTDTPGTITQRLYHRVRYLISLESSLGLSFTEEDVPSDVKPFIAHPPAHPWVC
ncbi:hypothetical protein LTR56_007212 [Elasticomyces elasticus]|nr:hypothetical protein LTR56_007212 [Elasticomyces elasticus]KAK3663057.1 hypothetical protein LTR22_006221 [Elasticomyces elasticus]KAK4914466.1 hypothetical protein LTR49_017271 [Elasticomyces elasticus]KAK5753466.1 hypothetical protein LTS12_016418 [Elasticomyces elasticus]